MPTKKSAHSTSKKTSSLDYIERSLKRVVRSESRKLDSVMRAVEVGSNVAGTEVVTTCHMVEFDASNMPRLADLVECVCDRVVDYAIPRSKIAEAEEKDKAYKGKAHITRLGRQAAKLFTNLAKTGEIGEILLFILAEEYLKLPQIITKMSLKTNSRMHFHGADGVYASVDKKKKKLCLYWGESKIHSKPGIAIYHCLKSLTKFLAAKDSTVKEVKRDFQLLQDYVDLNDPDLEDALKIYLDRKNTEFNKTLSKGIAFVGFNDTSYPANANKKTAEDVHKELLAKFIEWKAYVGKRAKAEKIDTFEFHIFMLPVPSIKRLRKFFIEELGL